MHVKLPAQVYAGKEPPHPTMMQPISNDPSWHWKPLGGLWTSTYHEDIVSEWIDWCKAENFGGEKYPRAWMLQPAGAWMAVIQNPDDLHDLTLKYQRTDIPDVLGGFRSLRDILDYERIAQDYDGLWLPNPHPFRFDASLFFNVFDVESTIWFRWSFLGEPVELEVRGESETEDSDGDQHSLG